MKIEHLEKRVNDYKASIKTVVEKKILWKTKTRNLLLKTLKKVANQYDIGWRVQELNWMNTNDAVNITFDSFPPDLIEQTNKIPRYQFIQGAALVFSQSYSGDINVFTLYPIADHMTDNQQESELSFYTPQDITEKVIIQKVDEFLSEMIHWEVPTIQKKVGF